MSILRKVEGEPVAGTGYDQDFFAWSQTQAKLLKRTAPAPGDDGIDWSHLIEEIESLGAKEKREIRSRLKVLLLHLLKWRFQPEKRKPGWKTTIDEQRLSIGEVLEDSPSLQHFPADALERVYRLARIMAIDETELDEIAFPAHCPFSIDEILDDNFYPEG